MQAHGTEKELAKLCRLVHRHYDEYTSELFEMYAYLLHHRADAIDPAYEYYERRMMETLCAYCLLQHNLEETKEIHFGHHHGLVTIEATPQKLREALNGGPDTDLQAKCIAGLTKMLETARERGWYDHIHGWYKGSHLTSVLAPHAKLAAQVDHAMKKERWVNKWEERGFPHHHALHHI